MNKFLADSLGWLNAVLAIVIVLAGWALGLLGTQDFWGAIVGAVGGFLVAVLICGVLAVLISIHNELKAIHIKLAQ